MSRAFRLGVFIVAALLILAVGVFWIGSKRFLFSSTYRLYAEFQNVSGLSDGAEVRVGGMNLGAVKRIDLPRRPDEKVRVAMDLKGETRNVVKNDSVAAIRSEGLIGDKYIEITFGTDQAPPVKNGDTIRGEPSLEIADLFKKANSILESAQGTMQNVNDTTGNLKDISTKVNQGTGTIGALVNDKSMYREINAGAAGFQENMEALKHNFLLRGFFHKRGYEDITELTRHAIPQLPAGQPLQRFTFEGAKIFDKPDTAKLKNTKVLNEAGMFLQDNPFGLAVIAGYTDMKGDTEKNKVLTEARALVVRDYLVENFKVDDKRIKTIGLGKSAGVDPGGRVDVLVYPASTVKR